MTTTVNEGNAMHAPSTDHRAGRMMEGLLASKNPRAKLVITVDLCGEGAKRYHQTFTVKRWEGRDGTVMLTVAARSAERQRVLYVNTTTGKQSTARESASDALLVYAAKAALAFAYTGEIPTAKNGVVTIWEEAVCGCCGMELTDPVSIERGIGPQCYGKQTGTKTITSRRKREAVPA